MNTNQTHVKQQFEGTRLAVAAYAAADIKTLLSTNPSTHQLSAGLHSALIKHGFNIEQANNFVQKYSPVAALDQDGAGAVLFRINDTNEIATAIRGTNPTDRGLSGQLIGYEGADLIADGSILQNQLPIHQTVLVANFVLQETTPAGEVVPQLAVEGGSSNAADLLRSSNDSLSFGLVLASPVAQAVNIEGKAEGVSLPKLVVSGTTLGTGRAVGPCVDAAGHSEGSPEVTVIGSAIAQCARITTVNGPGVSLAQMQHVAAKNEFMRAA